MKSKDKFALKLQGLEFSRSSPHLAFQKSERKQAIKIENLKRKITRPTLNLDFPSKDDDPSTLLPCCNLVQPLKQMCSGLLFLPPMQNVTHPFISLFLQSMTRQEVNEHHFTLGILFFPYLVTVFSSHVLLLFPPLVIAYFLYLVVAFIFTLSVVLYTYACCFLYTCRCFFLNSSLYQVCHILSRKIYPQATCMTFLNLQLWPKTYSTLLELGCLPLLIQNHLRTCNQKRKGEIFTLSCNLSST